LPILTKPSPANPRQTSPTRDHDGLATA
jgi:hypothetical protein